MRKRIVFTLLILLVFLILVIVSRPVVGTYTSLNSPLPTPFLPPSATPEPSTETQKALDYLARREKVAPGNLIIVNEFRREASLLGRTFQAITVLDTESGSFFQVLVDLDDGQVEDRAAIEEAEEQRHRAQYGKLQPALYERLQAMREDEMVTVTFWLAVQPERGLAEQQTAAFATLAAKYPEAREAMERSGKPMDVEDPVLAECIYDEYVQILNAEAASQIRSLVEALEALGFKVRIAAGLPAVTATLPKRVVEDFATRDDVGVIYLSEGGRRTPALDSAIPSNLAPAVWTRGYDGTGVDVAILEESNVDFTSPWWSECPGGDNCFRHQGPTQGGDGGVPWHATLVASVAASDHTTYRGIAPGATIMSAGIQGPNRQDDIDALIWALDHGAEVVNASYRWCTVSTQLDDIDRAFDHYARARNRLFVVAAGNNDDHCPSDAVDSPAKGWNVLSVGAYDDHNDSNWSNDEMANWSAWVNPSSPNGDLEKPEVVAPGVSITGIEMDGNLRTEDGTSFAAPQVAGLAALFIDRHSQLIIWPEAIKAIIMASAVHNIDGPSGIPSGQDLKDGAGAIDAALADMIAQTRGDIYSACMGPCWWGVSISNTTFPVGTYMPTYPKFYAAKGERVRVAITWWSKADCVDANNCNYDRLDTDLQLNVFDPNWQSVSGGYSGRWDNNYELVDFVAPQTGEYKIGVYKQSAIEDSNYLGIAWVKDATYLPDLRNKDGWVSELYVRNDGAEPRSVQVQYYDGNGNPGVTDTCDLGPNQWCPIVVNQLNRIPYGTTGSAIVSGGEDVSVVVKTVNTASGRTTMYNGIAAGGGAADPAFEQVGSTLYAPAVYNQTWNWNSTINILNIGTASTVVTVQFRGRLGYNNTTRTYTLNPNETEPISSGSVWGSSQWLGSLIIQSDNGQPLAATMQEVHSDGGERSYNATAVGQTEIILPAMYKDQWGITSGLVVQNVGSTSTNVTLTFYDRQGNLSATETWWETSGRAQGLGLGSYGGLPANWPGWIKVSSSGQPLAVYVNTKLSGDRYYAHTGTGQGGTTVTLPWAARSAGGRTTGYTLVNPGLTDLNVTARYYDGAGNEVVPARRQFLLSSYWVAGYHQNNDTALPLGWQGSIVLEADGSIWAIMREDGSTTSSAYTGIAR